MPNQPDKPAEPNPQFRDNENVSTGSGDIHDYGGVRDVYNIRKSNDIYDVSGLPNPYLGLGSYTYDERDRYAGRKDEVEAARKYITDNHSTLYFIVGASGSGKSSFAQAGLIPALKSHYDALKRGRREIQFAIFTPGAEPLTRLNNDALNKLELPDTGAVNDATDLITLLHNTRDPLVNIIVLDQMEELFIQSDSEQGKSLLAMLTAVASQPFAAIHTHIICTLRADYLPNLFDNPTLYAAAKAGSELRAMSVPQLEQAIQQPLWSVCPKRDKSFEKHLLEHLAADAAEDATYLPLLQVTLTDIWQHHRLDANYRGLADAIKNKAEGFCHDLATGELLDDKTNLILALLTDLITVVPGVPPRYARKGMTRRALVANCTDRKAAEEMIDYLSQPLIRLISITPTTNEADRGEVNIIHESLIHNWPRLDTHVQASYQLLLSRHRFEDELKEWEQSGRADSYLLTGIRLAEARLLAEKHDAAAQSDAAQELIRRSVAQQQTQQQQQALAEARQNLADSYRLGNAAHRQLEHHRCDIAILLGYEAVARDVNEASFSALSNAVARTINPFAILSGHDEHVLSAVFSPDGQHILTASADKTAKLWDGQGKLITTINGHEGMVHSAVFSPDSQLILTASYDNIPRLWDLQGKLITTINGHEGVVHSAVFSPDGWLILTASEDGTTRLWHNDGQPVATLSGHEDDVRSAVFSPDGQLILTASDDRTARLWRSDGQPLAILSGHEGRVNRAVFSPDGQLILTASEDGTARLWDSQGNPFATLSGHDEPVLSAVFSPDSQYILTASNDGTARLWDLQGKLIATLSGHRYTVYCATFSLDGQRILTASWDGTARLWDAQGNYLATLSGHTNYVLSAVFSPDGQRILTASVDKTARLWDLQDNPITTLSGHEGAVNSAVFSPNGNAILTTSQDNTAKLWDKNGKLITTLSGHEGAVTSAVFSPDGNIILTASNDSTARLWDKNGKPLATLGGYGGYMNIAMFSPDGNYILTHAYSSPLRLWDLQGNFITNLDNFWDKFTLMCVVFSPDKQSILTASQDGTARLWDKQGKLLATLSGHTSQVNSAVFSPDGQLILTASCDDTAKLWDLRGNNLATLSEHEDFVTSAVFSPDGKRILTASLDGTSRIWSRDGEPLLVIATDVIDFSADGTRMFVRREGNIVQVLPLFPADLLAIAACRLDRELREEERRQYNIAAPRFRLSERVFPPPVSWEK